LHGFDDNGGGRFLTNAMKIPAIAIRFIERNDSIIEISSITATEPTKEECGTIDGYWRNDACRKEPCNPPDSASSIVLSTPDEVENAPVKFWVGTDKMIGLEIDFPAYAEPVDIYLMLLNQQGPELLFVDSNNLFTMQMVSYAMGQTDALNVNIDKIGMADEDAYWGGWFVAPANGGDILQSMGNATYELGVYVFSLND